MYSSACYSAQKTQVKTAFHIFTENDPRLFLINFPRNQKLQQSAVLVDDNHQNARHDIKKIKMLIKDATLLVLFPPPLNIINSRQHCCNCIIMIVEVYFSVRRVVCIKIAFPMLSFFPTLFFEIDVEIFFEKISPSNIIPPLLHRKKNSENQNFLYFLSSSCLQSYYFCFPPLLRR